MNSDLASEYGGRFPRLLRQVRWSIDVKKALPLLIAFGHRANSLRTLSRLAVQQEAMK